MDETGEAPVMYEIDDDDDSRRKNPDGGRICKAPTALRARYPLVHIYSNDILYARIAKIRSARLIDDHGDLTRWFARFTKTRVRDIPPS